MTIYIVVSREKDIPSYISERIVIEEPPQRPQPDLQAILDLPYKNEEYHAEEVIKMNKVSIRYGNRTILHELDWTVRNGEHWALSGRNGSGKSTLLSLVCADNPQSYACDISLFGWARGTGETIWQIKRHIGYVSPEMHRSYHRDLPALRIVASGLKDTVGLYVKPTEEEKEQCRWWMRVFGIEHLADRSFLQISSGEQRMVLLARAFVKDPELLILDEPLHGLDEGNRQRVKDIVEAFCKRQNKTLIFVTHYEEDLPPCIDHRLYL
jgi:molybdate transport system ATP-binding protein